MATRVEAVHRRLDLILAGITDGSALQKMHVAEARAGRDDILRSRQLAVGVMPIVRTRVDGIEGSAVEAVKPFGIVEFRFDYLVEFGIAAQALIAKLSPVLTGNYRDHHLIFVDGEEVEDLRKSKPKSEVAFVNVQPYARKIEGAGRKTPLSPQAPNGVYDAAARTLKRRYGSAVRVVFEWRGVIGGEFVSGRRGNKSSVRFPMISLRTL